VRALFRPMHVIPHDADVMHEGQRAGIVSPEFGVRGRASDNHEVDEWLPQRTPERTIRRTSDTSVLSQKQAAFG
jgi:hypothetical protein